MAACLVGVASGGAAAGQQYGLALGLWGLHRRKSSKGDDHNPGIHLAEFLLVLAQSRSKHNLNQARIQKSILLSSLNPWLILSIGELGRECNS